MSLFNRKEDEARGVNNLAKATQLKCACVLSIIKEARTARVRGTPSAVLWKSVHPQVQGKVPAENQQSDLPGLCYNDSLVILFLSTEKLTFKTKKFTKSGKPRSRASQTSHIILRSQAIKLDVEMSAEM